MKGNCTHIVRVRKDGDEPGVHLFNDDDNHYYTVFESSAEVDDFVQELRKAAIKAFGTGS